MRVIERVGLSRGGTTKALGKGVEVPEWDEMGRDREYGDLS